MSKGHEDLMQNPAYQAKFQELKARLAKKYPNRATLAGEQGYTGLHYAGALQYEDEAKRKEDIDSLIKFGADINAVLTNGGTPLHLAAANGRVEAMKLLIERGGNVHAVATNGLTPLHEAAAKGHVDAMKLLIERGGNVNVAGNDGSTPLHWAAVHGHVDAMKLLIERGANVNVARNDGSTLLHSAAAKGHVDSMKLLIELGGNVHAAMNDGRTPLRLVIQQAKRPENAAKKAQFRDSLSLLLSAGALMPPPQIAEAAQLGALPVLVQQGDALLKEDPSHPGQPVKNPATVGRDSQKTAATLFMGLFKKLPFAKQKDTWRVIAREIMRPENLHKQEPIMAAVLSENSQSPREALIKQQQQEILALKAENASLKKRGRTEEVGDGGHVSALPAAAGPDKRENVEPQREKRGREDTVAGILFTGKKSHVEQTGEPRGRE